MRVTETELPGVLRIEPRIFRDARGELHENWNAGRYEAAGVPGRFVQDNVSISPGNTLRGLHLQEPHAQGKLVQVLLGEVFDVAVDVRVGSPTFSRWVGATLNGEEKHQLYIPPGFAHGFCVMSETALVVYKCDQVYHPQSELVVAWDDPELAIVWPIREPLLSPKDTAAPRLAELRARLPRYRAVRT